jgi:hypothetical protein
MTRTPSMPTGTSEGYSTVAIESTVTELTPAEAHALFDSVAWAELGVSGEEFVRCLEADEVPSDWSPEAICRLEILLPFSK